VAARDYDLSSWLAPRCKHLVRMGRVVVKLRLQTEVLLVACLFRKLTLRTQNIERAIAKAGAAACAASPCMYVMSHDPHTSRRSGPSEGKKRRAGREGLIEGVEEG